MQVGTGRTVRVRHPELQKWIKGVRLGSGTERVIEMKQGSLEMGMGWREVKFGVPVQGCTEYNNDPGKFVPFDSWNMQRMSWGFRPLISKYHWRVFTQDGISLSSIEAIKSCFGRSSARKIASGLVGFVLTSIGSTLIQRSFWEDRYRCWTSSFYIPMWMVAIVILFHRAYGVCLHW